MLRTFTEDKTELIFDLNRNNVSTLSSEIENELKGTAEKIRLFAMLAANQSNSGAEKIYREIVDTDPLLVYAALYSLDEKSNFKKEKNSAKAEFLKRIDKNEDYFETELIKKKPLPIAMIKNQNVAVWDATYANEEPLLGIGISIVSSSAKDKQTSMIAVGYMQVETILKNVLENNISEVFVVGAEGKKLIHANMAKQAVDDSVIDLPIVKELERHVSSTGVMRYKTGETEQLGAYSRINIANLGVISQTDAEKAYKAVSQMKKRSMIFALIITTLTMIVTLIFARKLTAPLYRLVTAMHEVAKGQLDTRFEIKTNDEIGIISETFGQMTRDLKTSRTQLEEINRDLEEKVKERTRQLEEIAIRDPLTNCYNRRYFNTRLNEELKRAKRHQFPVSIIYLDIDHFKKYNDTNGHPMGDVLLKQFSTLLAKNIRDTDFLARLGGEEFCIVFPQTALKDAAGKAERIRAAIEKTDFPNGEKQPLGRVTASLGVSEYPTCAQDDENLIKAADAALYHIKESGRNQVGVAKPVAQV